MRLIIIIFQAMLELDEETQKQTCGSLVEKGLSTNSDRPVLRLANDPDEGSDQHNDHKAARQEPNHCIGGGSHYLEIRMCDQH